MINFRILKAIMDEAEKTSRDSFEHNDTRSAYSELAKAAKKVYQMEKPTWLEELPEQFVKDSQRPLSDDCPF